VNGTLGSVNAAQMIISTRRKLQSRHALLWLLFFILASGYILSIGWVISFFSHSGGIAFIAAGALIALVIALRKRCFRRFTSIDASRYLDNALQSKDRFVSFV